MAIQGVDNNSRNINFNGRLSNLANKAKQGLYDICKNHVVGEKADKFYKFAGDKISPAEVRLILGGTALMSQPFIDFHNRKQDENTRWISVCRTVAKIIAGTLTGFLVRKGAIKLVQACSKMPAPNMPKWRTLLTPKDISVFDPDAFLQYQNTIGNLSALVAMLFTNFAIDAPLTKILTNKFSAGVHKRLEKKEMRGEA